MDRRSFLRTAGAAAGVAAVSEFDVARGAAKPLAISHDPFARLHELTVNTNRGALSTTLSPWTPAAGEWNVHTAGHLYRRAGFSATMSEINVALAMSPSAVVDKLLDDSLTKGSKLPTPPKHSETWLTISPKTYGSDTQREQLDYAYATSAIRRNWAVTMTQPDVMLREKMVYFWANHFVIESQKVYFPQMMYNYLDYFRKNPWGNFKQMVKDVSILPAMLYYLDGAYSLRTAPNENYARELMELFTLGAADKDGNPNYTESDIHEVAKALTGYTFDVTADGPNVLPTIYQVANHDSSFKTPFADAGAPKKPYGLSSSLHQVSDDIIDALFQYKGDKLAYFICSKLYQYFVYHQIGEYENGIIAQMADTFKNSNWELKPVIAQLLKSEHFFDDANIGAAIKSPYEYMLGMCRQFDVTLDELMTGTLWSYGVAMEQSLLDPPNVKGWPGYRSWISTNTLPIRNKIATAFSRLGTMPATGASGYGENYTAINLSDTSLQTWANQFASYKVNIDDFIDDVSKYLCAIRPSDTLQKTAIRDQFTFLDYEWTAMSDDDRLKNTRKIIEAVMLLPEYELM